MLNLVVANQQRNDLTAQQVLPPIVEGLTRLKLSMEANISSVPTERVTTFGRRQRHQGRQPQTYTEMMMPDHPPPHNTICTALPKLGHQHLLVMSQPPSVSIIQLMSTSIA